MKMKEFSLIRFILVLVLILGTATVFATNAMSSEDNGPNLYANESNLAVETPSNGTYFNHYENIQPGEYNNFGGYALKSGDRVEVDYHFTGGDLEVRMLEYSDQRFDDKPVLDQHDVITIPEDGSYYFLIHNRAESPSNDIKMEATILD
ncbi:hypothetical protein G4V62_11630 [Bacillaceae bacterium SIJ1]|uniref:hypothetical protein n=1 Tax=Litoribacterium kuwaitense TaxID=1398745 RepID=UPI0013ED9853|nr:hypothetical protein [Litoribacterium kuwaitense]NGP45571.1 hypothetical protein [Litoribacterium kuwaitense]